MRPTDLSIGQRLFLGAAVNVALLLVLVATWITMSGRINELNGHLNDVVAPRADWAGVLQLALLKKSLAAQAYAQARDARYLERFQTASEAERAALARLAAYPEDPDALQLYAALPERAAHFGELQARFIHQVQSGAGPDVLGAMALEMNGVRDDLVARTDEYVTRLAQKRQAALEAVRDTRDAMTRILVTIALVLVGAGLATAIVTTRAVRSPAKSLVRVARQIEAGDYAAAERLARPPDDGAPPRFELNELAASIQHMAESLSDRERRLGATARVSTAIAAHMQLDLLAAAALDELVLAAGCQCGAVWVTEDAGLTLRCVARHALPADVLAHAGGDDLPGQAARSRRSFLVADLPADAPFAVRLGLDRLPPRAMLATPLLFGGGAIGAVLLASVREIGPDTIELIEQGARQLAIGIRNAMAHQQVELLAAKLQDANRELERQNDALQLQADEIQSQNGELHQQSEEIQAQNRELVARNERIQALSQALRQRNAELQQRNEALARADRQKDEFLALLSHELRNPLAAMRNAVAVLREAPREGEGRAAAAHRVTEVVERQIDHQARLVEDLLDVSRIKLGKIALSREPLDLRQVVSEVAEAHRAQFVAQGLAFDVQVPDLPVRVIGDRVRVAQTVANLLGNALKFTDRGGTVRVRCTAEAHMARVAVRDTGIGIPREALPHVFEALYQADASKDRARGGLGLGLAVVKEVVERLGGGVTVLSDGPGKGAEFAFALPVTRDAPELAGPGAPRRAPASVIAARPLRVLVVEDHRDGAEALGALLELWGHHVSVAASGPEGLEAARREPPDVMLCDIGLPGMDGYALARELRRDPATAGIHLVALTGYVADDDRQRCADVGFERTLSKPADPVALQSVLAEFAGPAVA